MKKLKLLILFTIIINLEYSYGQKTKIDDNKPSNSESIANENNPLVVINGIEFENFSAILNKISANDIEKMDVKKSNIAINAFGKKAKNGVIIIHLKNKNITTFEQLNKEYNLDNSKPKITITGTITDCENIPLPGVKITNLFTKESFYSDLDGNFSATVNLNDVLEFTYSEMESKQMTAKENSKINIQLKKLLNSPKLGEILIKKPVIYLYPTQKTDIIFSLDFKGELLTTFPKYDNKWTLTAYPNGQIFDKKTNRFYSSLFWDGTQNFQKEHYNYQSGFVVSKNDLTHFLIKKLEYIGLNNLETNEFVQYWLPILEKNETNFIHFYVNADYDKISKNNIFPKPDTSIRIFMEFYGLDNSIEISEQNLSKTERKGFTLVEWGGSDVSKVVKELNTLKL
jgi:hypothetical protein